MIQRFCLEPILFTLSGSSLRLSASASKITLGDCVNFRSTLVLLRRLQRQGYVVAEPLELAEVVLSELLGTASLVVVFPQVDKRNATLQHVVDGHQQRMRNASERTCPSAAPCQAMVKGLEIGVLLARGRGSRA